MLFLIVLSVLSTLSNLHADGNAPAAACLIPLEKTTMASEAEVSLDPDNLSVTYRGVTFRLVNKQFILLSAVLNAPDQTITVADLSAQLWTDRTVKDPLASIHVYASGIRSKFKAINPDFTNLILRDGLGLFWARAAVQPPGAARVRAAPRSTFGYADGTKIKLQNLEHLFLKALLKHHLVTGPMIGTTSYSSFKTAVSHLNIKFRAVLGVSVAITGPPGSRGYILNPALRG